MSFARKKENFVCEYCGTQVGGNGYTNHCPSCLWSKHVDVEPGDRAARCSGMMGPVAVEGSSPHYRIVHRCRSCGLVRRVDTASNDNGDAIVALSGKSVIMNA